MDYLVVTLRCPGNWKCHSLLSLACCASAGTSGCHFSVSTGSVTAVSNALPFLAVVPLMCGAALLQWTLILHVVSY